jgi:ubiquinone/menaquinone biosynthesis C-methylase UbiE
VREIQNQKGPNNKFQPLRTGWFDPVWSKVIAAVILGIIGLIVRYFQDILPSLEIFYPIQIPLIYFIVVSIVACLAGYWLARKRSLQMRDSVDDQKFNRVFETKESVVFYGEIADKYDERNTDELLQTHRDVVTEIKRYVGTRTKSDIFDIGGGTGRTIAEHFYDSTIVRWIYVDACSKMVDRFRYNMSGVQLRTEAHVMTLNEAYNYFSSVKFDLIVMSFLISSLSERPDFIRISQLMSPGGLLIVADADPAYTRIRPYYSFTINDESVALRTNPIHNLELRSLCEKSGLMECSVRPVMKRGVIYSYVAVFQNQM